MMRAIKIGIIVVISALLIIATAIKIDSVIIKDFDVINLPKIYAEEGYPVNTTVLKMKETARFIKDLALVKKKENIYQALISRDLLTDIYVGSEVFAFRDDNGRLKLVKDASVIKGKVISISNEPDWQTGLYRITVKMNKPLSDRTFNAVKIVYKTRNNTLTVPIINLENSNNKYYAWINDNQQAKRIELKTGVCDGYECEIIDGLKKGDKIITSDLKGLSQDLFIKDMGETKND